MNRLCQKSLAHFLTALGVASCVLHASEEMSSTREDSGPLSFMYGTQWVGTLTSSGSRTPLIWEFRECQSNLLKLCARTTVGSVVTLTDLNACSFDGSTLVMNANGQFG